MSSQSKNPWDGDTPYDYSSSWVSVSRYTSNINRRITGDPETGWLDYAITKFMNVGNSAGKSCLVLGSNEGGAVMTLRAKGFQGTIVASDIAEKALTRSLEKFRTLGLTNIEILAADLNSHVFGDAFDYIIAEGVLHHIERLEFCAQSLYDCLKPGGLLVAMEFVGAFRFQFSDLQKRWINAALAVVPRQYRPIDRDMANDYPPSLQEQSKIHYVSPSIEDMLNFDPSEAVAGHKLDRVFKSVFHLIEEKDGGGNLVMNITGHFPFETARTDENCGRWLDVLTSIENTLIDTGVLQSDLKFYCFKKVDRLKT